MCDELTSTILKVSEPYKVLCYNISSHSETWDHYNIREGVRCPYRECEWLTNSSEPSIRWREEDAEECRIRVMSWFLRRWPTAKEYIAHCVAHAFIISAASVTELPTLPDGLEYLYADSVTELPTLPDGLEYLSADSVTELPTLPDGLETLYAASVTELPTLPDGLKYLYADSVTELPTLPDGLEYLSADSVTELPTLPDGLEHLSAASVKELPTLPDGLKYLYAASATNRQGH